MAVPWCLQNCKCCRKAMGHGGPPSVYPDVVDIVKALAAHKVELAIASRSPSDSVAKSFLRQLAISQHFASKVRRVDYFFFSCLERIPLPIRTKVHYYSWKRILCEFSIWNALRLLTDFRVCLFCFYHFWKINLCPLDFAEYSVMSYHFNSPLHDAHHYSVFAKKNASCCRD